MLRTLLKILTVVTLFLATRSLADMTVTLVEPTDGAVIAPCDTIVLKADVQTTAGEQIKDVRFYANGKAKGRARKEPWEYTWKKILTGNYVITAKATDVNGVEAWSDPIHIKAGEVMDNDLVINGNFSCGTLANWSFYKTAQANATVSVMDDEYFNDPYYLYFEIENGGVNTWDVQITTPVPTDSGHVYEVYFEADADESKMIQIAMMENKPPYSPQWSYGLVLDGDIYYGPIEFEATRTDPANLFRLDVGSNNINCYFDNLAIVDRSATGVKYNRLSRNGFVTEYELDQAWPNPFNMSTTIRYKLAREARVDLDIYNMQGRKIKSLVSGVESAGTHVVKWRGANDFGAAAPSGVYLYRMTAQSPDGRQAVLSRKILLLK